MYFFIPLDIFKKNLHNKGIQNRLDGWFTFLSSDAPEDILSFLNRYPDFRDLYEHVYQICRNTENILGIFSEELRQMDRNTLPYMINEIQETIDKQQETIEEMRSSLSVMKDVLAAMKGTIAAQDQALAEKGARIRELKALTK